MKKQAPKVHECGHCGKEIDEKKRGLWVCERCFSYWNYDSI